MWGAWRWEANQSRGVVAGEGLLNGGIKPWIKKNLTHTHTTHTPLSPSTYGSLSLHGPMD